MQHNRKNNIYSELMSIEILDNYDVLYTFVRNIHIYLFYILAIIISSSYIKPMLFNIDEKVYIRKKIILNNYIKVLLFSLVFSIIYVLVHFFIFLLFSKLNNYIYISKYNYLIIISLFIIIFTSNLINMYISYYIKEGLDIYVMNFFLIPIFMLKNYWIIYNNSFIYFNTVIKNILSNVFLIIVISVFLYMKYNNTDIL